MITLIVVIIIFSVLYLKTFILFHNYQKVNVALFCVSCQLYAVVNLSPLERRLRGGGASMAKIKKSYSCRESIHWPPSCSLITILTDYDVIQIMLLVVKCEFDETNKDFCIGLPTACWVKSSRDSVHESQIVISTILLILHYRMLMQSTFFALRWYVTKFLSRLSSVISCAFASVTFRLDSVKIIAEILYPSFHRCSRLLVP